MSSGVNTGWTLTVAPSPRKRGSQMRIKFSRRWWKVDWHLHNWLIAIGWVLSATVPFGLGLLLYVPDEATQQLINIVILFMALLAFIAPVVAVVMRYRERAYTHR